MPSYIWNNSSSEYINLRTGQPIGTTPVDPGPDPEVTNPLADTGSLPLGSTNYSIPAGAIFMATNGSDSNNGTQSSPVATLEKAIDIAPDGGTVVVRAGVYNDGQDTQHGDYPYGILVQKNITIQNYPSEAVWFDGSVPVTDPWTQNGSTWSTPYDRLFDRSPTSKSGDEDGWGAGTGAGGWWTTADNPQASWPDMVFYDGVQLEQVTTLGEVGPGTFFIEGYTTTGADPSEDMWFQGQKIHIGDNPAGHEVRYANKAKFITFVDNQLTSTLRGVGVRRYASNATCFGAVYLIQEMTIENVVFEDIRATAIHLDQCKRLDMTKVTARRIGFNFMGSNRSGNITIDRADMRQCNYAGWNLFGPAISTIKFNKVQYATVKNSIFKDTNGSGFWVDSTANTPIVVNTLFENLTNRPLDYETASDGILANCKFINNGADTIFINDSDTTRIYNCTLAGNNWGVKGAEGGRGNTTTSVSTIKAGDSNRAYDNPAYSFNYDNDLPASYYTDHPERQWTINKLTVHNTIIARPGVNAYITLGVTNAGDDWNDPNRTWRDMELNFASNVYHWTTATRPQYPWALAGGYNQNPDVCFTLPQLQAMQPGLGANSVHVTTDPLDSNDRLADTALHANAVGLPSDIAALIGQPAGTKHIGAFW